MNLPNNIILANKFYEPTNRNIITFLDENGCLLNDDIIPLSSIDFNYWIYDISPKLAWNKNQKEIYSRKLKKIISKQPYYASSYTQGISGFKRMVDDITYIEKIPLNKNINNFRTTNADVLIFSEIARRGPNYKPGILFNDTEVIAITTVKTADLFDAIWCIFLDDIQGFLSKITVKFKTQYPPDYLSTIEDLKSINVNVDFTDNFGFIKEQFVQNVYPSSVEENIFIDELWSKEIVSEIKREFNIPIVSKDVANTYILVDDIEEQPISTEVVSESSEMTDEDLALINELLIE